MRRLRRWFARHPRLLFAASLALLAVASAPLALNAQQAVVYALNGTVSTPSFAFWNFPTFGLWYNSGRSSLSVSASGVESVAITSTSTLIRQQIRTTQATAPTVSSCGSATIVGTDTAGIITMSGSASTCNLVFNAAWSAAPACVVQVTNRNVAAFANWKLVSSASGTTQTQITAASALAAPDVLSYVCMGRA